MGRTIWQRIPFLLTIAALIFQIAAICILCSVPPVSRDALTHHLALPKIYLAKGLGTELPHILFSYSPMNIDLLYMLTMRLTEDVATKYVHFFFGLLTAYLIYRLLRRWNGRFFGLLGAYFFLSLPVVVKLSITAYVDLGLAFFSMAAIYAIIHWMADNLRIRFLCLAAVCCGLALGTKYNGLLVLGVMALSIPVIVSSFKRMMPCVSDSRTDPSTETQRSFIKPTILFCLIAGIVYAPWGIRNFRWTGNPIYPLYQTVFEALSISDEKASLSENDRIRNLYNTQINRDHFLTRRMVYKETPLEIALIPVRIFFQGKDDNPKLFDGKLHPLLFFFPVLIFFSRNGEAHCKRLGKLYLFGFAWLFILMAFLLTDMRIRYIAPAIPPLVILSVLGLKTLIDVIKKKFGHPFIPMAITITMLLIILVPNLRYLNGLYRYYQPLPYLTGQVDRESYIEHFRPEYPVMQYINEHVAEDAKLLSLFGGNRRYYCDRELFFNNALFKFWLETEDDGRHILDELKQNGFTHIVVNRRMFDQWLYSGLTLRQRQRADVVFSHMELLFMRNGHMLYRL